MLRFMFLILFSSFMFAANWMNIDSAQPSVAKMNVLRSNIYSTTLHFELDGYWLEEVEGSYVVRAEGTTPIFAKDAPDLTKITSSIIIPDNGIMKHEVILADYVEYNNISIMPSKGHLTRDINPNSIPYSYGESYQIDEFYPGKLSELRDPYILRDFRGQTVIVYPFQYNPMTKTLRVYTDITIEVESNNDVSGTNVLNRTEPLEKIDYEFGQIYAQHFENYGETQTRYDILEERGNMLVICNDAFLDEIQPLVDWKNFKGIPTELVALSEVGSSSSAIDNYVSDYYYNQGLTFLLLVGDINQMPSISVGGTASDPSYGYISGNDYYPEIMVGRFSAENSTHVQTQVQRTINHERYPSGEAGAYRYGVGVGSAEGAGIGDEGESDYEHLDNIRQKLMNYNYIDLNQIYDSNGGNSSQVTSAVNSNRSLINYTGHGSNTSWGSTGFSNSNVNALTNTEVWPAIISVACVNGAFDQGTCFAEAWLRATHNGQPSGALIMTASTVNQQWATPMEGQDEFNDILVELYSTNIKRTYGGMFYNGTMRMVDTYGSNGESEASYWHVFGDPSVVLRNSDPININPNYDATILIGQSDFVVDAGIDGALVALSSEGVLLTSAFSSASGIATLDISELSNAPGTWDLSVTAYNAYPYAMELNVIAPEGPYVVLDDYAITSGGPDFNNGESITIGLIAENVGVDDVSNVQAMITTNDAFITVVAGNIDFGNLAAGQSDSGGSPLVLNSKYNTPNGHSATLDISFYSGDLSWSSSFSVTISSPEFTMSNPSFDDNNGDGIWDAGETAEISLYLSNLGDGNSALSPGIMLESLSDDVQIITANNSVDNLNAGQSTQLTFEAQANSGVPLGTTVQFLATFSEFECESDCFTIESYTFSMVIGHPTVIIWDPESGLSGSKFVEFLESTGRTGYDYVTGSLPSTEFYNTAFIFLGIYYDPSNHVLSQNEADKFVSILNNGGNVYMEGGDTWAFDSQTSLHGMFGANGISDGTSDLGTVNGVTGTFTEGMSFSYNGGNSYIDHLSPSGGSFNILTNQSPSYVTAIAYDNEAAGYRTIAASHELGGLQGDDADDYFEAILNFFEAGTAPPIECEVGDMNGDGAFNILDIVSQVNLVIGLNSNPSDYELCAADINGDGEINILDVVQNINLILGSSGTRRAQISRKQAANDVTVIKDFNKLSVKSDGTIAGMQIELTAKDISINNQIDNMDVTIHNLDNEYTVLVYSIDQNLIASGITDILDIKGEYKINDVIIANGSFIRTDFILQNIAKPETFVLNQNYPNPFNPVTTISFVIGMDSFVDLTIYDLRGRQVYQVLSEKLDAGKHQYIWNGRNQEGSLVPAGVYFYKLSGDNMFITKKMVLMQ